MNVVKVALVSIVNYVGKFYWYNYVILLSLIYISSIKFFILQKFSLNICCSIEINLISSLTLCVSLLISDNEPR